VFTPITTERLLLRPPQASDLEALWARRSHPEVARHQNWSSPYTGDQARELLESVVAMDGPADDEWWMLTIVEEATEEIAGDLALHQMDQGHTMEIGYTLAREHWGRGFAVEAVTGLLGRLFDGLGITRAMGALHPDNRASAMVLERTGFLFEGNLRSSYWVGDEVTDDWVYGMTRDDWEAWRSRPTGAPANVGLVEVTADNVRALCRLAVHKTQESFVAPVAVSLAQARVPPEEGGVPIVPWYRGIEADDELAGFVMVALSGDGETESGVWRLLIDRMHQRRGIAGRALDLVEAEMRGRGDIALVTSWVDGKGSPAPFYEARGYVRTGEVDGGEAVARKVL
jgi:RimJ/RimL family protein N-acetyltransferase/GNAT superfamily N-acetyltransferase